MARSFFIAVLLFALAAAATFHASGAVSVPDARMAVALDGSLPTLSPHPVSTRVLGLGVDLIRRGWAPTGVFRALHLAAGILLAFAALASALVAARCAKSASSTGLAAAAFLGLCLPLGADTGGLGLLAHPVPVLLALLSGAAWAWSSDSPRPFLGGLLVGLALADHALVTFLLPGFGAFALLATLRMSTARSGQFLRVCAIGVLIGFSTVLLPWLAPGRDGLVHVITPTGPGAALAAWASGGGAFWTPSGPHAWGTGVVELARALWRNAGPVGVLLGFAGFAAFVSGAARRARPFLVVHVMLALAIVVGRPADPGTAAALLGWSFLFWATPALARVESRLAASPTGALRGASPTLALLAAVALLFVSIRSVDHSAEKGVTWTRTVLDTLPKDAILLTRNPVAMALAADGLRADLDVLDLDDGSTLGALRSGRPLLPLGTVPPRGPVDVATFRALMEGVGSGRAVFLDPSVYFDVSRRDAILGDQWAVRPHGLAFRLVPPGGSMSPEEREAAALAWSDVFVTPATPPSPLRDGLGGSAYFARSLVQSGYLHLEQDRPQDAERDFLLALGHPDVNRNVAAMGFARVLFSQRNLREVVRTLDTCVQDERDGAWLARRLEGNVLLRLGDHARGLAMLRRALALTPSGQAEDRARLQKSIRDLENGAPTSPARGAGIGDAG